MGARLQGAARKGCLGVVLLFGCVLLVGLGALVYGWVRSGKEAGRFGPMAVELQAACDECFSRSEPIPSAIVRHGRVLIVSADTGAPVGITVNLMDEAVRARTPEELGTVVCATPPVKTQVGTYTDGAKAYQESREVCAFTWPERTPLFALHVVGPDPPAAKAGRTGDQTGGDPVTSPLMYDLEAAPDQ